MQMTPLFRPVIGIALLLTPALTFAPIETGELKGRITDQSGCPVSGVLITVASEQDASIASAKTKSDGTYRFDHLPAGPVTVSAKLTGFASVEARIFLYDGDNLWDSNFYVSSIEGMKRHRVVGTVSTPSGTSVSDATVTLVNAINGERIQQVRTDKAGKYSFAVRAGDYVIAASSVGRGATATFVTFGEEGDTAKTVDLMLKGDSPCNHHRPDGPSRK
jgi:hypothetical protein